MTTPVPSFQNFLRENLEDFLVLSLPLENSPALSDSRALYFGVGEVGRKKPNK